MVMADKDLPEWDARLMALALEQAKAGYDEGGYPVGAVLARGLDVLTQGRNLTAQLGDPTAHGEAVCLRGAPFDGLDDTTLYTTLSPCVMCAGTIVWLGIGRVVIGDRTHYTGYEGMLRSRGVEVIAIDDEACIALMARYLRENPEQTDSLAR